MDLAGLWARHRLLILGGGLVAVFFFIRHYAHNVAPVTATMPTTNDTAPGQADSANGNSNQGRSSGTAPWQVEPFINWGNSGADAPGTFGFAGTPLGLVSGRANVGYNPLASALSQAAQLRAAKFARNPNPPMVPGSVPGGFAQPAAVAPYLPGGGLSVAAHDAEYYYLQPMAAPVLIDTGSLTYGGTSAPLVGGGGGRVK